MTRRDRLIAISFRIGAVAKGVDGLIEFAGGILLLFADRGQLHILAQILTRHELAEDPGDVVAGFLLRATRHLSADTRIFGAIYLLVHGAVKAGLVAGLLSRARWTYPAAIGTFLLFVGYQVYRLALSSSPLLLGLTVVDIVVIALTWLEYGRLKAANEFKPPPSLPA
jgi:uncharacterized membrane protein